MTDSVVAKRPFGSEVIPYIRRELANGSAFSRNLAEMTLEDGGVVSYLPHELHMTEGVNFGDSLDLRGGGAARLAREATAEFVSSYLRRGAKRIALFETLSRIGDSSMSRESLPYVTHFGEVYFLATHSESDPDAVLERIKWARHYPFVAGLIDLIATRVHVLPHAEVPAEDLAALARKTTHILIGAFDMEGFLIWSRDRSIGTDADRQG